MVYRWSLVIFVEYENMNKMWFLVLSGLRKVGEIRYVCEGLLYVLWGVEV